MLNAGSPADWKVELNRTARTTDVDKAFTFAETANLTIPVMRSFHPGFQFEKPSEEKKSCWKVDFKRVSPAEVSTSPIYKKSWMKETGDSQSNTNNLEVTPIDIEARDNCTEPIDNSGQSGSQVRRRTLKQELQNMMSVIIQWKSKICFKSCHVVLFFRLKRLDFHNKIALNRHMEQKHRPSKECHLCKDRVDENQFEFHLQMHNGSTHMLTKKL
ncbi:unnamed protein product [Allacma fusca]|uniref:Uncharacterized protein n=1 Tax=Allacma fusca TaxID=39272 RepID=A0A8J2JRN5_9HEXA|nr:unnamed protein product [Allacma fusca]